MNILIIDNDTGTRKITKTILKELNCEEIFEAADSLHAFNILKDEDVELIISNWDLAKTSGIDLLKKVRSTQETTENPLKNTSAIKNIPFIMVLNDGDRDKILQAIKAQVSQCIIRPFSTEMLLEKVKEVLK